MLCRHETLSDAILEGCGPRDPQPGPDLAARIQDGDLITNSGFFDHPTACVQANSKFTEKMTIYDCYITESNK